MHENGFFFIFLQNQISLMRIFWAFHYLRPSHAQKAADYLHGLQPNADTAPAEDLQEAA
jgi:hypothetical protein